MNVLGLDVGFSVTKATNSFCLLNVDQKRKEIGLVERAERFLHGYAPELFRRLSRFYPEIRWVSVCPSPSWQFQALPRTRNDV
jgi:hypothetical protein